MKQTIAITVTPFLYGITFGNAVALVLVAAYVYSQGKVYKLIPRAF